ncbi:unnamed protein product, partial [Prorocentrum cordatum]
MSQPSFIKQEARAKLPQSANAENPDKVEKPKNLKRENLKKEEKPLQGAKGSGSENSDNEEKRAWQKAKRRKSAPQPEDEEPEGDEPEGEGPEDGDPESVHTPALHLLPERLQRTRESLPFENARDMFEGLRQELGPPRPPENTQQHLTENAQQHEAEVEHSGDELEAEAESPTFRESEMPEEAGSETAELDEEGSRPQELAPEESKCQEQLPEESSREPEVPDDEDSNRHELVPEEVKRQELLPEESMRLREESEALAFASHGRRQSQRGLEGMSFSVAHSSSRLLSASEKRTQNEQARSGMANQVTASKKPAQAARESKPTVAKKPAQAVSRKSEPTVSKKPSRAQIEGKTSTDKLDAVVQVETEVKMETTLKPESSWSETEIETHLDPAQEAELHASWRAERFNSGELTGLQGDVLLICVWSDNPMHYTYLKVAKEEFQDVAIEYRDSLKVPSESAKEAATPAAPTAPRRAPLGAEHAASQAVLRLSSAGHCPLGSPSPGAAPLWAAAAPAPEEGLSAVPAWALEHVSSKGASTDELSPSQRTLLLRPGVGAEGAELVAAVGRVHQPDLFRAWLPDAKERYAVSRLAFEVSWPPGGGAWLRARSTNPVYVDGHRAQPGKPAMLTPGSEVLLVFEQSVLVKLRFCACGGPTESEVTVAPPAAARSAE